LKIFYRDKDEISLYNEIDWRVMDDFINFFTPIKKILDLLQSAKIPTMCFSLSCMRRLKANSKNQKKDSQDLRTMKTIFNNGINLKFKDLLEYYEYHIGEFLVPFLRKK
jgi:hypothetical protein